MAFCLALVLVGATASEVLVPEPVDIGTVETSDRARGVVDAELEVVVPEVSSEKADFSNV
jgi:hypothetical protein